MENGTIKKQIMHLLFLLSVCVGIVCALPGAGTISLMAEETAAGDVSAETVTAVNAAGDMGTETVAEETAEDTSAETVAQPGAANAVPEIEAPSAILMEASTGQVICEKDADTVRSPASITKIMTLLLIFDQLHQGKISLQDEVTTSARAKSMGGSQVFLEEGEIQSVETLIKCIAVASGNDASVAMAERIAGSEDAFVEMMNQRAQGLGMTNTHFEDCSGLTASEGHHTTARDVALMARELITKYPEVFDYTKIWMEDIVHTTQRGSSNFTLSSTNKLLKQYDYTTGLKTGSTSIAKYCFCATARKDGIDLIAVVMAAPDPKTRFGEAKKLLEYGFALSQLYQDDEPKTELTLEVIGGNADTVKAKQEDVFRYLDTTGADLTGVKKQVVCEDKVRAPFEGGQKAGEIIYSLNGKEIGRVPLVLEHAVSKATFRDIFQKVCRKMLL